MYYEMKIQLLIFYLSEPPRYIVRSWNIGG